MGKASYLPTQNPTTDLAAQHWRWCAQPQPWSAADDFVVQAVHETVRSPPQDYKGLLLCFVFVFANCFSGFAILFSLGDGTGRRSTFTTTP